jgi:DNA-binding FrmR family transcriptional regulator
MKKAIATNLKKASGNIERVLLNAEGEKSTLFLLQLNAATLGLLKSVQRQLIQQYLEKDLSAITHATTKASARKMLDKVVKMVKSYDK